MKTKILIPILLLTILAIGVQGALLDNLVQYYGFDDGSLKADNANYKLSVTGSVYNTSGGFIGNAYNFTATASHLTNTSDTTRYTAFTVCAWVKKLGVGGWDNSSLGSTLFAGNTWVNQMNVIIHHGTLHTLVLGNPSIGNCADTGWFMPANNWYYICAQASDTNSSIYINGVMNKTTSSDCVNINFEMPTWISNNPAQSQMWFQGIVDEVGYWNRLLSKDEIVELYNEGSGLTYPFSPPPIATINLSSSLPVTNSAFNVLPLFFNLTANISEVADCHLWINSTLNQSKSGFLGTNVSVEFNVSALSQGIYTYIIGCNNSNNSVNSSSKEFSYDFVQPFISTNFNNNSFYFKNNVTAMINVTDNVYLFSVNISVDGLTHYNKSGIGTTFWQYNFSQNSSNYSVGAHYLSVRAADGHTSEKLKSYDDYNPIQGDSLVYDIRGKYDKTFIKIYEKNGRKGDSWSVIPKHDRFEEVYVPSVPDSTMTFVVESDRDVYFAEAGSSYGGGWLIIGDHWKDFVLNDEPNAVLSFSRKNKNKFEVTITGLQFPERLKFSSTGDLNINIVNYTFYVVNITESFTTLVYSGFSTSLNMVVNFGVLTPSLLSLTPVALLQWDGVNYSTELNTYNSSHALFNRSIVPPAVGAPFSELVAHRWFFNFSTLTNGYLNTSLQYQNVSDVVLGLCNTSLVFPILNISYYDEISNLPLNVSNSFNLNITDGTYYYDLNGTFPVNTTSRLCTNVNPGNNTYNWEMFGTFTMSASNYITRIFSISSLSPTILSNNPVTNLSLYLIAVNDSSTVTFTWQTTEFQNIEGVMEIYKCNNDSSRSLVESLSIIGGQAIANIQLLFTAYSYEVVLNDGRRFASEDFAKCHIESTTEREFFIDIQSVVILPVIGLFMIDCKLENTSATTAKMTWNANVEDPTSIEACIVGKRGDIYGLTEVYRNCTNQTSGSFEVAIPALGTTYYISGELKQNGAKGQCRNTLSYFVNTDTTNFFGMSAVLCVVFLIISLALMYAGDGEKQLFAAGIGLLASWFLGVIVFPWEIMTLAISFLAIIVLIGRYTKKAPVG